MEKNHDAFFKRLLSELEQDRDWPGAYLFKFIVPTDRAKIEAVKQAFDAMGAVITTKRSKNETYTSISIHVVMGSALEIVNKYKEVAHIEGIISL